jgi:exodeoxyribonuclease V alpha subunit
VRYLSANVSGLGERRASLLLATLGEAALLARLAADPEAARPIFPGATGERVVFGLRQWARDLGSERWCVDLAPKLMAAADVGYVLARRIVTYFDAPEVADLIARRDTYRLLEVPGVGWKRADAVALSLGVAREAPERLAAAILASYDALVAREGHTAVPGALLITRAIGLVGETHRAGLRDALERAVEDCDLVPATPAGEESEDLANTLVANTLVSRPRDVERDWMIANLVETLAVRTHSVTTDESRGIETIIRDAGLTTEQGAAVRMVMTRGLTLLTGGPGTGKTHTLRAVLDAADALGLAVTVVAPTGKAAARAAEMSRRAAMTIHRLLDGPPGSMRAQGPITSGVVIVEEASMVDAEVMAWLAKNVEPAPDFRMVIVGDEHQLPSVGAGRVLSDLLSVGTLPTARLTIVQRQAAGSRIVQQAHRILGRQPLLSGETHDWTHVPIDDDAEIAQREVVRAVRRVIADERGSLLRERPFDPTRDLQVLSPRVRGPLGVTSLNAVLRAVLNPRGNPGPWIAGGERVRVGDRVTCIANDYTVKPHGLMNGELGVVESVVGDAVQIALDDGRVVTTRGVQNANLSLAFASTVHRSQGSEYAVVLLVYHASHEPLLDQRVLYTAITRAKQRVVLCTDHRALVRSAERGAANQRHSALATRITTMVRDRVTAGGL